MSDIIGDAYHGPERRGKAWWRSWTLWFNGGSALMYAAEAHFGLLAGLMPPKLYNVIGFAFAVVNAGLRWKTTQAIALYDKPSLGDGKV